MTIANTIASAQILKLSPTGDIILRSPNLISQLFTFDVPNNQILDAGLGNDLTQYTIPADNLPTFAFHLFLEAEYFDGITVTTYLPQIDITWCPLLITQYGIRPLSAPMIVPVAAPIMYTGRVPASYFGFAIRAPTLSPNPATYSHIRYHMGVSQ